MCARTTHLHVQMYVLIHAHVSMYVERSCPSALKQHKTKQQRNNGEKHLFLFLVFLCASYGLEEKLTQH